MRYSILIADDEKITLHLLEKYLLSENNKYTIHKAFDGKQTLNIAKSILPDIIILNWEMPLLNGEKIIEELNKNYSTRQIPIIVIFSDKIDTSLFSALKSGAVDFIKKPIDKLCLTS